MTVIRPNGISGVTSITSSGDAINFYKSDGTLGPVLGLNINATSGISTFAALNVTGVLTYEDVTSVDSVGIITARSDLSIADKIIHTGDTNTAIRFPAADTVTVETSGSEALRITSSGNMGLGTASPGVKFDVVGTSVVSAFKSTNNQYVTQIQGNNATYKVYLGTTNTNDFLIANESNNGTFVERLRIDSSGRLLLGTTTEGYSTSDDLTIATSGNTGMTIRSGTSNFGSIHFSDATSGTGEYAGVLEYSHSNDSLAVYTSAQKRLTLDSSGRLLLGTTTEGEHNADNLTIADSGNCGLTLRSGSSSYGTIYFSDATSGNAEYDGYIDYNQGTSMMRFGTASTTRAVIDSSGRMGLGTASPTTPLTVQGNTSAESVRLLGRSSDDRADLQFYENDGSTFVASLSAQLDSLNLFLGSSSGELKITGNQTIFRSEIGSERMRIDSSGRLLIGTTDVYNSSDKLTLVNNSGNCSLTIDSTPTGESSVFFADGTSGQDAYRGYLQYNHTNDALLIGTSATERLRIDSSGDVGIGNDASFPIFTDDRSLILGSGSGSVGLQLYSSTTGYNGIYFGDANSGSGRYRGYVEYKHNDDWLRFAVNGQERVRIDSSGRMGVGTNSPGNKLHVVESSATPLLLQSSGVHTVYLRLQNTDNARGYVGYEEKRLAFYASNSSNTGDTRVAFLDADGLKFFNDTAQANALDDYEEGTWTPVLKSGNNTISVSGVGAQGRYIKIGKLVYIGFTLDGHTTSGVTGGDMKFEGLPFTSNGTVRSIGSLINTYNSGLTLNKWPAFAHLSNSSTTVQAYYKETAAGPYDAAHVATVGGATYIQWSLTYETT